MQLKSYDLTAHFYRIYKNFELFSLLNLLQIFQQYLHSKKSLLIVSFALKLYSPLVVLSNLREMTKSLNLTIFI